MKHKRVKFEFQFVDDEANNESPIKQKVTRLKTELEERSHNSIKKQDSLSLSLDDTVQKYELMHIAIEHNTMYYRLSPAQKIWLRRDSKWRPMLLKIGLCIAGLAFFRIFKANSMDGCEDKCWLETFLLMMTGYQLAMASLYMLVYPIGEAFSEVPVMMAFILMRFITAIIGLSLVHLYFGIQLEVNV